jgi:hypothetical protein
MGVLTGRTVRRIEGTGRGSDYYGGCERCGKPAAMSTTGLHVGHILSVADGLNNGLTEDIINSDDNLIAECDECNGGHGAGSLPVRLFVTLLMARQAGAK